VLRLGLQQCSDIQFRFLAQASFLLIISASSQQAKVQLSGLIGAKAYALFIATTTLSYEPDPFEIVKYRKSVFFTVGPVPVLVTARSSAALYFEAAMMIEGAARVEADYLYRYDASFEWDKGSVGPFWSTLVLVWMRCF